jgi:hypothetical protein
MGEPAAAADPIHPPNVNRQTPRTLRLIRLIRRNSPLAGGVVATTPARKT